MTDEELKPVAEEIGRLIGDEDLPMMARANIDNERQYNLFLEWARAAAKEKEAGQ